MLPSRKDSKVESFHWLARYVTTVTPITYLDFLTRQISCKDIKMQIYEITDNAYHSHKLSRHSQFEVFFILWWEPYLVMMQLHVLSLQHSSSHSAKAKTASQELQPDRGEQWRGLEDCAGSICIVQLAALLLHAWDQHHNLVECFQTQLDTEHIQHSNEYSEYWLIR